MKRTIIHIGYYRSEYVVISYSRRCGVALKQAANYIAIHVVIFFHVIVVLRAMVIEVGVKAVFYTQTLLASRVPLLLLGGRFFLKIKKIR